MKNKKQTSFFSVLTKPWVIAWLVCWFVIGYILIKVYPDFYRSQAGINFVWIFGLLSLPMFFIIFKLLNKKLNQNGE